MSMKNSNDTIRNRTRDLPACVAVLQPTAQTCAPRFGPSPPPRPQFFHSEVDCVWNVMAHAQKPDFFFRRNGRVHLNRQGRQFSRLLAVEMCASAVVMLDTPCSEVVWRVLVTNSIRQFPLHFPSRESPCAITFQLDYNTIFLHRSQSRGGVKLTIHIHLVSN